MTSFRNPAAAGGGGSGMTDAQFTAHLPLSVTGLLTDTQLRATAVPVSIAGTVPISAVALPLPAGAATEATLGTRLADATFTARLPLPGQALMVTSIPVVLASDQSTVNVNEPDLGSATVDAPAAASVLDRLARIGKAADAQLASLKQLVVLSTPLAVRRSAPTLMHRA